MGLIHPVVYGILLLAAAYAAWLGALRFLSLHLGKKLPFPWKKHVFWGSIVLAVWAIGPFMGFAGAQYVWGGTFIGEQHAYAGIFMLPLAVVGYLTGLRLDKVKKRRKLLPAIHGINNILLLILALFQVYSGIDLVYMVM